MIRLPLLELDKIRNFENISILSGWSRSNIDALVIRKFESNALTTNDVSGKYGAAPALDSYFLLIPIDLKNEITSLPGFLASTFYPQKDKSCSGEIGCIGNFRVVIDYNLSQDSASENLKINDVTHCLSVVTGVNELGYDYEKAFLIVTPRPSCKDI